MSADSAASAGGADEIETGPAHLAVAHSLLDQRGIDHSEPTFAQLIRTDLDRDGNTEVLAVLERGAGEFPSIGDYGIVFVMFEGQDAAEPLVVYEDVVTELSDTVDDWFYTATSFRIDAVGDVNGDRTDEVLLRWSQWASGGSQLLEWQGAEDGFTEVLSTGCGI